MSLAARPKAIGRRAPLPEPTEDLRDPAHGERVPRCAICGMPERPGNKLYPGLWGYIRTNIPLTLCERDVRDRLPVLDPDPLTLADVA